MVPDLGFPNGATHLSIRSPTGSTDAAPRAWQRERAFDIVAIATSLGGLNALTQVLPALPKSFPIPILVVQHLSARFPSHLVDLLNRRSALPVTWARTGERLRRGMVYVAPPNQHLLVGIARSALLSSSPHVQFVRPSADVLFQSVAATYRERAIAVMLTGTRRDGAAGVRAIKRAGGRVLAQDAATSTAFGMPQAAIATGCVDFVLPLRTIAPALVALTMVPGAAAFLRTPRAAPMETALA